MRDSGSESRKDRGLIPGTSLNEAGVVKEGKKINDSLKINQETANITLPLISEVSIESNTAIEVL